MKIRSIHAAVVKDPTMLGRTGTPTASTELDFMNPLVSSGSHRGRVSTFAPPWGEAICVVVFDTGDWGVGLTAHAATVLPVINDYLGPMITGETVEKVGDIIELWDVMATVSTANIGISGVVSYAISAIDLALYDGLGKRLEVPVYELLGGAACQELHCYATGANVQRAVDFGFTDFKIPCPWPAGNVAAVEGVVAAFDEARAVAGDGAKVMVDCWAVMDVEAAVSIGEALSYCDPWWIEDYVNPQDWTAYELVRSLLPDTRLAAGERWFTHEPFRRQAVLGTIDVVQPDPLWVGGATPTIRIAEIAAEHELAMAIHCAANDAFGQHLAYALESNTLAEYYLGAATSLGDSYRSTPGMAIPVDGVLVPSDSPGFGIELTIDAIDAGTYSPLWRRRLSCRSAYSLVISVICL